MVIVNDPGKTPPVPIPSEVSDPVDTAKVSTTECNTYENSYSVTDGDFVFTITDTAISKRSISTGEQWDLGRSDGDNWTTLEYISGTSCDDISFGTTSVVIWKNEDNCESTVREPFE